MSQNRVSAMVIKKFYLLLLTWVLFLIFTCELPQEDEPPDTPIWVQKTQPQDSIERGIDAEPLEHNIFMHWHPVTNPDLEGYKIFRADIQDELDQDEIEVYHEIAQINLYHNPEYDTVYYDENVELNRLYRYYIRSYDYDGNMSEPSDTIEYKLINKASLVFPTEGQDVAIKPVFKWRNTARTNEVVIRLEKYPRNHVVWITRFNNPSYTEELIEMEYNFDGSARQEELDVGQKYRWRIDCISFTYPDGTDLEGSESTWQYFTVNKID